MKRLLVVGVVGCGANENTGDTIDPSAADWNLSDKEMPGNAVDPGVITDAGLTSKG